MFRQIFSESHLNACGSFSDFNWVELNEILLINVIIRFRLCQISARPKCTSLTRIIFG